MISDETQEVFILGLTEQGKIFRPSDWAERLADVMSQFRPGGEQSGRQLGYSPWCLPTVIEGVKCLVANRDLREHHVLAWDFVMNFAKDNQLQTRQACLLQSPAGN
ncbi:MAG: DUF3579 domain-containing protein [Burkholderiaceae bacterium]